MRPRAPDACAPGADSGVGGRGRSCGLSSAAWSPRAALVVVDKGRVEEWFAHIPVVRSRSQSFCDRPIGGGTSALYRGWGGDFGGSQRRVRNFAFQSGREISHTKPRVFRETGTRG